METVTLSKESFGKILVDIDVLLKDLQELEIQEDALIRKRKVEIATSPSRGKTEEELHDYLKKRGVRVN